MKRYFLGLAAHYSTARVWQHTFTIGRKQDVIELEDYLVQRYGDNSFDTEAILCKNGRSALCLALKAYFKPGDKILVNGFTCYAVYEAIKEAGLKPVFVDINMDDLNFDMESLSERLGDAKGIIVQNSLGNPVDIKKIEKLAEEHELKIIEDLAHSAGRKYPDGREIGTVGAATVLSFGKDKSIDTVSGGAVILRDPIVNKVGKPNESPRPSDHLRARFYPVFGAICRGLMVVRLGGLLMRLLVKIHWVERSADNKLDLNRKISRFEARLALKQLREMKELTDKPLRTFYLVWNREKVIKELQKAGFYFGGLWYERPVSPERYYDKVHFPEKECPVAVEVAKEIINFPTYYDKKDLASARKIIKKYKTRDSK